MATPPQLSLYTKLAKVSHDGGCVITKDPDILGGEPLFRGTRVPVTLILLGLYHCRKNMPPMDKELIFEEPQNNWT